MDEKVFSSEYIKDEESKTDSDDLSKDKQKQFHEQIKEAPFFTSQSEINPSSLISHSVKEEAKNNIVDQLNNDVKLYGTGKPKRVIIRANTIHD